MTQYRAFVLDRNQQVARVTVLECASDEEAGRQAAALAHDSAIELWNGKQRIRRFDPASTSAPQANGGLPAALTAAGRP